MTSEKSVFNGEKWVGLLKNMWISEENALCVVCTGTFGGMQGAVIFHWLFILWLAKDLLLNDFVYECYQVPF